MESKDKASILDNLVQEFRRGTLVFTVLLNLDEPGYGYSLIAKLKESGVDIEQNTLYPLLRRLEKQGLLDSMWDTSESRPRKYYVLSTLGKEIRQELVLEWQRTQSVMEKMLPGR